MRRKRMKKRKEFQIKWNRFVLFVIFAHCTHWIFVVKFSIQIRKKFKIFDLPLHYSRMNCIWRIQATPRRNFFINFWKCLFLNFIVGIVLFLFEIFSKIHWTQQVLEANPNNVASDSDIWLRWSESWMCLYYFPMNIFR